MIRPPEPPPEGALIERARNEAKLSVREAARRAGISEGWWRQVAKGYQSLSGGNYGPVRDVPADTIAKMARAANITPEQLATEGQRPDAAQALLELREQEPPVMRAPAHSRLPDPPEGEVFARYSAAAAPLATQILRRLDDLRRQGIQDPDGPTMFPDDEALATGWETGRGAHLPPEVNLWVVATARTGIESWRREQNRAGQGSA